MTGLSELYQEVILDHNNSPRNFRESMARPRSLKATTRSVATEPSSICSWTTT
jgi:hypothetical protein